MAGSILVGYDGSDASKRALEFAIERAKASDKRIVLCSVVPATLRHFALSEMLLPGLDMSKLVQTSKFVETAERKLEEVAEQVRKRGMIVVPVVRAGDAADELVAAAKDQGVDEVVLGYMSYEHKLPYGIGSVAEKVMRTCDRTVTVVRGAGPAARGPPSGKGARA